MASWSSNGRSDSPVHVRPDEQRHDGAVRVSPPLVREARRNEPLRGVHGCRGPCVANPIGDHRRARIRSVHRARSRYCASVASPMVCPSCQGSMHERSRRHDVRPSRLHCRPLPHVRRTRCIDIPRRLLWSIARVNLVLMVPRCIRLDHFGFTPGLIPALPSYTKSSRQSVTIRQTCPLDVGPRCCRRSCQCGVCPTQNRSRISRNVGRPLTRESCVLPR